MDHKYLADLLFPNVNKTPEEVEAVYPQRNLPEGAKVTRFAPSPTGYVHLGGMYQSMIGERLAHQSGGVFFLRIEDTDSQREIKGAAENLIRTLSHYGVNFDEGASLDDDGNVVNKGNYGPYIQSKRADIYHVFAKKLVSEGKAYPVFTTEEELAAIKNADKKTENKTKDWEAEAAEAQKRKLEMRSFTIEDAEKAVAEGRPFVLRILADGDPEKKTFITDLVKGKLELPENDEDFVLLKSDGIPTYHFAHAVDDHLMGTTHVIRGEEWLPSLPKHIMLFRYLGFKMPKYLHTAQIMRLDENGNKKKLSKRDMGANMDDYDKLGYDPACVCEYLLTLLNSNFEEWRMQNADKPYTDFPFNIKKMSVSGCLFDFNKLNDVSKNVISRMSADQVYERVLDYTSKYDEQFHDLLAEDPSYAKAIFAIGRGGKKPRKDITVWANVKPYIGFFYDPYYEIKDSIDEKFDKNDVKAALSAFCDSFDINDDMNTWFEKIKSVADKLGFASDMKLYKAGPENYKGSVADISMFLRVAVSGMLNSPDMYAIMQILGAERTVSRINNYIATL